MPILNQFIKWLENGHVKRKALIEEKKEKEAEEKGCLIITLLVENPHQQEKEKFNMAKKVSWLYGGKRYYGTLIRETKTHKYARTTNGKVKTIKKK